MLGKHIIHYSIPESCLLMEFKNFVIDHEQWLQNARRLKTSADILFEKLERRPSREEIVKMGTATHQEDRFAYFQSYMLLTGYALENIVKGYSIYKYGKENKWQASEISFKYLKNEVWKVKNGHKISLIAQKSLNQKLSDKEKNLLERFENFVIWSGRYTIPKSKNKFEEVTKGKIKLGINSQEKRIIDHFFSKIFNQVNK